MKPFFRLAFTVAKTSAALLIGFVLVYIRSETDAAVPVVGLWRFNEGSGTNISDSSGLGNNGSLSGENGNVPGWDQGPTGFGGALRFTNNGSDHAYVQIPGTSSLKIGQTANQPWSITVWAYEDSEGTGTFVENYGRLLVLDGGTAFQFESGAQGDEQLYTWSRADTAWQIGWGIGSAVAPLLDQWVHWAVVYDATNLTIYRNGNQGASGGIASTPVNAALGFSGYAGGILIGSELAQPADRTWNGLLDDVAIFAGALSETEVRTVMSGDFSAHLGGPAHILSQPQSQTVQPGGTATFSVVAQGVAPLSFQWFFNATKPIAGETDTTLSITNVQVAQAGAYSVSVSNVLGTEVSQAALLTVNTNRPFLVGLWRFDEGSGTNTVDSSGFTNHGTLTGENGDEPAWAAGQTGFGGALWFTNDGADHAYVDVPGSSSLMIGLTSTDPWTITAWAYEDSGGTGTFLASYGRLLVLDGGDAFQLESGAFGDAQMYTWSRQNTAWQVGWGSTSNVAPVLDQWVHWAVVYDGSNLTLYRNANQGPLGGKATVARTAPLGFSGYTGAVQIGSEIAQPPSRNWNGALDDVAIFNGALSQQEINTVKSGDFSSFFLRPSLSIDVTHTNLTLRWPASPPGYQLQSSPALTAASWSNVVTPPVTQGDMLVLTVSTSARAEFFRLVRQ